MLRQLSSACCIMKWSLLIALGISIVHGLPLTPDVSCHHKMADIVFALDTSVSVWEEDFTMQLEFVKKIVSNFEIGANHIQVGLIIFGTEVHHQFYLNDYLDRDALLDAISRTQYVGGGTNTGSAIKYARDQMFRENRGRRQGVAKIIVVVTDGLSVDTYNTALEASIAINRGVEMFAIGVGYGVDAKELTYISSKPTEDHLFRVDDFAALESIQKSFTKQTCQGMVSDGVNPTPLEIKVDTYCGGKPADVFFVIDCSSSIWEPNFQKMLKFVQGVTNMFDIGPDKTRVGVVAFSDGIHPVIPLDNDFQKPELLDRIAAIPYLKGGTRTGSAISFLRERGFATGNARQSVAHVAIILTDGQSANLRRTLHEAQLAKNEGIYLYALGIGDHTDASELRQIASEPVEKYMHQMEDFDALVSFQEVLAIKTCKADLVDDQELLECSARNDLDVMFVFDSYSMGRQKSDLISAAISDTIPLFDKITPDVRTGALQQNSHQHRDVPLATYQDGGDFLSKLSSTHTPGLRGLIHKLRRHEYSSENGGRQTAQNVAVMFLDTVTDDYREVLVEAERAKFRGQIELFVVAIGTEESNRGAQVLASEPVADHFIPMTSFKELKSLKTKLLQKLCQG